MASSPGHVSGGNVVRAAAGAEFSLPPNSLNLLSPAAALTPGDTTSPQARSQSIHQANLHHQEWSQGAACESRLPADSFPQRRGSRPKACADGQADPLGTHVVGSGPRGSYISDASFQHAQRQSFLTPESPSPAHSSSSEQPFASDTWQTRHHSIPATNNYLNPTYDSRVTGYPTQPQQYFSSQPQAILNSQNTSFLGAYPHSRFRPSTIMSDHGSNDLDVPATAQMHPVLDPTIAGAEPTSIPRGASEEPESPEEVNESGFSPRRGFTHKRSEDPPRNTEGKMVCKFTTTCGGLIFERRCEWR